MRKSFLVLTFLTCFFLASSQNYIPYYNLVNEAEYQLYLGKSDLAFGLYSKAISLKKIEPKAKDLYLLSKIYLERDDKKNALKYLRKVSEVPDGALTFWIDHDKNFFLRYLGEYEYQILVEEAKLKEDILIASTKKWLDSLEHYQEEDQRLRKVLADSIKPRFHEGQKVYDLFMDELNANDYQNQVKFLNFIKKYGYPGLYMTGSDVAATILMHIECNLYPSYKETLYGLLAKGKMEPFHYAQMVDRIGCICEGKTTYHSTETCKIDWETMLNNRESIGVSKYFNGTGVHPIRQRSLLEPK